MKIEIDRRKRSPGQDVMVAGLSPARIDEARAGRIIVPFVTSITIGDLNLVLGIVAED
ncbi:MAG: hypothetical protein J4N76_05090 [Chloroflexi bacterium]|nr:hypothetical protein [Chloroflexota bacterium]MCH8876101.1 hypothetical protein [Chloroflexota bacterium]MCI0805910.1 hypothetical protein [Chloroflexota bacterium]MCI0861483.1 hypothetical protein [Chloroflexota bacterium]MCI0875920.1 hypothetical protein [Chloroflexota bacterium]